LLINTYFKIKPFKLQDLEIGYKESSKFNWFDWQRNCSQ
jgi:hypothetical protein